jgi:hypothetical protein
MTEKKQYIIANSARCSVCGDNIFSRHRYDMVYCKCGNVAVDGGQDYLRRAHRGEPFVDTSISMDLDDVVFIVETLSDMREHTGGKDCTYSITMNVLSSLMNRGYMIVDNGRDLEKQFLTYCGEGARTAVVWALDTGRTNAGIVNAVIRAVRDAGFFKHKET